MVHIIHCQGHEFRVVLAGTEDGYTVPSGHRCKHCGLQVKTDQARAELTGKQS